MLRKSFLALTAKGRKVFAPLNARSQKEVERMLSHLSVSEQRSLIEAMQTIERASPLRGSGLSFNP